MSTLLRRVRIMTVVAALAAAALAAIAPTAASATTHRYRRIPSHNVEPPQSQTCYQHPKSVQCDQVMIRALDHARATLGEPKYHLPSRFLSLTGPERLLVLSNDDRKLYGLRPITGLNATLNRKARAGVVNDSDPSGAMRIGKYHAVMWTSNWASGPNPLFAYFAWMWDDGVGSGNIDCSRAHPAGCWGHRRDTLWNFKPVPRSYHWTGPFSIGLGVGSGRDRDGWPGWTELYEAFQAYSPTSPLSYLPSVTGLSRYSGTTKGGNKVVVHGYGFVRVGQVTVCGHRAHVLARHLTWLTIRTPRSRASHGYVVVHAAGGVSHKNHATAFAYR